MNKKVLLLCLIVLTAVLLTTACQKKEEIEMKDDYLVLVNKYTKLPDKWEFFTEFVNTKNAWDEDIKVEKEAYQQYERLSKALAKEGITIEIDSAYRSVAEQQALWDEWSADPEKGIEYVTQYVAVPGFSEHHTGLAIDICLRKNGELIYENDAMIAEKETFARIHSQLADYGFILRYPEGKEDITGYSYEPWHLRYVGSVDVAKEIMNNNLTLEEFLGSIENKADHYYAAVYQIERTLRYQFENYYYKDQLDGVRFNVIKVYTKEDGKNDKVVKKLKLGDNDLAFEIVVQYKPKEGVDPKEFAEEGEYTEELGWVTVHRMGVVRDEPKTHFYSLERYGVGW